MKKYEFEAEIIKHETLNSGYIEFPYDVEKEFGVKGQVKVKAYFDGYEYRGSLAKMGHRCHFIGLNQKVRNAIGKGPGDKVHVIIVQDTEERAVEIPMELDNLLHTNPNEKEFFHKLSYSHKREYIEWILSAKKEDTKDRRLLLCIEMLKAQKKTPK
ncbi:MAG TPA: YdeI/OmpD-associated family protein [Pseudobacteroides sp.]|uniref:YdeI/OmpD-associated family protein n=1 Tax=Pseudobacteroides sp. TaxID=1968840 RepID=UPI002F91CA10